MIPIVGVAYAYELRRGEEILSTGRLTIEQELAPGDELTIAGMPALVDEMGWVDGESLASSQTGSDPERNYYRLMIWQPSVGG